MPGLVLRVIQDRIMKPMVSLLTLLTIFLNSSILQAVGATPLRVHASNPRYFADGSGKAVYLTGSHTWGILYDFPPAQWPALDYSAYLSFLKSYGHNFFRMWAGESVNATPSKYVRTGPGTAWDGGLRLDLTRLNQAYFDRLRSRVIAARDLGIYVAINLFSLDEGAKTEDWPPHIFNVANNVNGINGDTNGDGRALEAFNLSIPALTAIQQAYVRKVIDTVNDLDNVLYEIGNEGDLTTIPWQYAMIDYINTYQTSKPKQHPVGMTAVFNFLGPWAPDDAALFASNAHWVAPSWATVSTTNPAPATGSKVILADVDHIWPSPPRAAWIWKCFTRGLHPTLMDWYTYGTPTWASAAEQEAMRKSMGYTLAYANRMNLAAMTPRGDLASTGYALANSGREYLVYLPPRRRHSIPVIGALFKNVVTVDLSSAPGPFNVEWFNPRTGETFAAGSVTGGAPTTFTAPFGGEAVLNLKGR